MSMSRIDDRELHDLKREWERRRRAQGIVEPPTDLAETTAEFRLRNLQQRGDNVPRDIRTYTLFQRANPLWRFTFLYPDSWRVREFEDGAHIQVVILGPRDARNQFNAAMAVHSFPNRASGGKYATLDQVIETFRNSHKRSAGFQEHALEHGFVGVHPATEIVVEYTLAWRADQPDPTPIAVIEHKIFLARESRFYEISCSTAQSDYATYAQPFRYFVNTLQWTDATDATTHPLILLADEFQASVSSQPALALAEKRAEYKTP